MNSKNKEILKEPLDLARCSKRVCKNESDNKGVSKLIEGIREFRKNGWWYRSQLNFGCEHGEYNDLQLPCVSDVPQLSAVFCMVQLMADLLRDQSCEATKGEFECMDPLVESALKLTAVELGQAKPNSTFSNQRALYEVAQRSAANQLLRNPAYYRVDRDQDWRTKKKPHFSNRLFRWVLACLKAKHPVLVSCPLITHENLNESMLDVERVKDLSTAAYPQMFVPAVAYEAATSVIAGEHLPVYQHGVRCRLFLPNKECCFRTIPDYFFRGWVKNCWLLTDPLWLDCIDRES